MKVTRSGSQRPKRPRGLWILVGLGLAIALSVGLVAGMLLVPDQLPAGAVLGPPDEQQVVQLSETAVTDTRTVGLVLSAGSAQEVRAPVGGIVTGSTCAPGDRATTGTVLVHISGNPLLSLHTDVPLWRDLQVGDRGDDVTAVQTALAGLGYNITSDGVLGRESVRAVAALLDLGTAEAAQMTTIPRSSIVWLPSDSVAVGECAVEVGETLTEAEPLMSTVAGLSTARLNNVPADMVAGDRVVVVGEQSVAVDGGSFSAESLGTLASTPEVIAALESAKAAQTQTAGADGIQIDVALQLAEPQTAWGVPATSVTGLEGMNGCVWSDGQGYPVHIVLSQLGKVFVGFEGDPDSVPSSVEVRPDVTRACQ